MGRIVSAIRTFGRQVPLDFAVLPVDAPIREALTLLEGQLAAAAIRLSLEVPVEVPTVFGDSDALQQVFINLLSNARDILVEMDASDRLIVISVESSALGPRVRVYDNGPGAPQEAIPRLFDPFFSTKSIGRGTGLGLSISDRIVREHFGEITYEKGPLGGACFVLQFPPHAEEAE
jgi:signal transduction histidine kinase